MPTMLYFRDQAFPFEPVVAGSWEGRLILDDERRALLQRLQDAEDENWYLGDRLPEEALFERTPWSWRSPTGTVTKLLRRFMDWRDGRVLFSVPETYLGPLYDWMPRPPKP